MKDWTHQIINELYNEHTEIASSLKIFAKNKLCINVSDEASSRNFCNILYELEHEGLITWKARTELPNEKGEIENGLWDERLLTDAMAYGTVKHIIGHFANDKLLTLTNTRVEGRLTIKGLDYAINFNRDKWKHIILVVSTILGTSFALIAALFSVLNYKKTTADYSPKLDSLTKSIQRIEIKSKKPDTVYTIPLNNL